MHTTSLKLSMNDLENLKNSKDVLLIQNTDYGLTEVKFEDQQYFVYSILEKTKKLELVDSDDIVIFMNLKDF